MRVNKFLNGAGAASRREADRLIEAGEVAINGRTAKLGDQVQARDVVTLRGKKIVPSSRHVVLAYHKPVGIIVTTAEDAPDNVMHALRRARKPLPPGRLFPVGRLDVASSGLLLLTGDTGLADRLMRPDSGIEKEYEVCVNKTLSPEFLTRMREGVRILGIRTRPAQVEQVDDAAFLVTLTEGKNRQIRRMCEALGYSVLKLVRVRIGGIRLGTLPKGEWRLVTPAEESSLRA